MAGPREGNVPLWARVRLVLLPIVLGVVHLAAGVEEEATVEAVTASKYDTRSYSVADNYAGCYTDGCEPELLLDGLLNEVAQSRWSCSESLPGTLTECYVTFDLGVSQSLSKMTIYFHKSNDTTRDTNPFEVSTSDAGVTFVDSFEGVNTAGTAIGVGEDFDFPLTSTGRYVRLTGVLDVDQWLSINEVSIYVDANSTDSSLDTSPAPTLSASQPTAVNTSAPTFSMLVEDVTPAPALNSTVAPTQSSGPTTTPTPGPTTFGGEACSNVTVSNVGDLNGLYSSVVRADGTTTYVSSGTSAATIASSSATAACEGSTSSDCVITRWSITPDIDTLPTYLAYDEATHPSLITEVWFRIDDCTSAACSNSPTEVVIVCGDGTGAAPSTPAPAAIVASNCTVIQLAGTLDAAVDGFYYDDGSDLQDGVAQYTGYDVVGDTLSSNNNAFRAGRVNGTCSSSSSATSSTGGCNWRQWRIEPQSSSGGTLEYFTYDDADHPVDIEADTLWYTSNTTVIPYGGAITVTCAPATTPSLAPSTGTPAPSAVMSSTTDRGGVSSDDTTNSSTGSGETPSPAETSTAASEVKDSDSNTAVIAGSVAGGVVLLAILGAVAYKLRKPPSPPPPSYDDLVGA